MQYLKITRRKRSVSSWIRTIELYSMRLGSALVVIGSLRWNRLNLCIDSIKEHVMNELDLWGLYV